MAEPYTTDWELIEGCRAGDRRAWSSLLDRYERLVYSIPLNYGLTVDDAADIAQLTFTIYLQQMDGLARDSNLAAWLATVARRHTWRLLQRRQRERLGSSADLTEEMYDLSDERGERVLARWEAVQWLEQGLARLDERCRRLLLALYFAPEQPSYAEVAAELDMAVGSVGPTRARCLQRLQAILESLDSDD